jgi:hypothetical protein
VRSVLPAAARKRPPQIPSIGHETVEKPPFRMGPGGPTVIHVGYTAPNIEEVYFPHASVVGDIGPARGRDGRPQPRRHQQPGGALRRDEGRRLRPRGRIEGIHEFLETQYVGIAAS